MASPRSVPGNPPPWTARLFPVALDGASLTDLLALLTKWNVRFLRANPRTPSIYKAGVRYLPEPAGDEWWLTIPFVMAFGGSVCHSLACWRAAELIAAGEQAMAKWSEQKRSDGSSLFHVRVFHANGQIEDPSLALGMNE